MRHPFESSAELHRNGKIKRQITLKQNTVYKNVVIHWTPTAVVLVKRGQLYPQHTKPSAHREGGYSWKKMGGAVRPLSKVLTKMTILIPYFWPKFLKTHTYWGCSYLYSRYTGVAPPLRQKEREVFVYCDNRYMWPQIPHTPILLMENYHNPGPPNIFPETKHYFIKKKLLFFFFVMVVANCNVSLYWLHEHCSQW